MAKMHPFLNAETRLDMWANALNGIGSAVTDAVANTFARAVGIDAKKADDTFRGDYLAHNVCVLPAQDATREWLTVVIDADKDASDEAKGDAPKQAGDVLSYLKKLDAQTVFCEAATWGRQRGGCLVYVGAEDGLDPQEPLNVDAIGKVAFLNVIRRDQATVKHYYHAPTEPNHGKPELYQVTSAHGGKDGATAETTLIHESRMLHFRGEVTTPEQRLSNGGWDDSVFERLYDVLQRNGSSWSALGNLLNKSNVMVFKLAGFSQMLAGNEDAVEGWKTRMRLNKLAMSVNSWLGIDAESESLENVAVNFGGVPETMQTLMLEVCAATGMPATKLWGRSPAGMNATGEGDQTLWDDFVSGYRDARIAPAAERLIELVLVADDGPTKGRVPDSWRIEWNPLREPSEREVAEIRKIDAEAAVVLIEAEVWDPDEVAVGRFGEQGYQRDFAIDLDLRRERLKARAAIDATTELEDKKALADAARLQLGQGGEPGDPEDPDAESKPGKLQPGDPNPPAPGKVEGE